jgi:hypothetical protein
MKRQPLLVIASTAIASTARSHHAHDRLARRKSAMARSTDPCPGKRGDIGQANC